jgi:hypothetical protein
VDLLFNDLSLHGQFDNSESFRGSLRLVMQIRDIARRHRRAFYCHRGFVSGQVTSQKRMPEALGALPRNERRAVMAWLSQQGPFWDDDRQHDDNDWYECNGNVVTDTAMGEAAHCLLHGIKRELVSLQPSDFMYNPVSVERVIDDENRCQVNIRNHWEPEAVENYLATAPPALSSWAALAELSVSRFDLLTFSQDAFRPLRGQPFKQSVAERIVALLDVLHRFRQCFDENGSLTAEGHSLYQQHFTGEKAWFSDSSDREKHEFAQDLSFPHPNTSGTTLFCTWHGKVKSPQYRIHFSWPITATTPVYVVYVGPKITKR